MLWADTEDFCELDLTKVGAYRYAEHPSMEVLLFPYAFDDDDPKIIDVDGRPLREAMKDDIELVERMDAVLGGEELITFHNSAFDRQVLRHEDIILPLEQIVDTMVLAYTVGLPGKLEKLGVALGLPDDLQKLKRGRALINRFCKPAPKNHKADRYDRYTHPEEWDEFVGYGLQDVVAMREIYRRIPRHNFTDLERRFWMMDQRINDRGVRVDMRLVKAAIKLAEDRQSEVTEEIQYTTWGAVDKHTKSEAIKTYCREAGVHMPDLTKETVEATLLRGELPDDVRRLLQLRLEANKATVSKYTAMGARTSQDGRLRGGFQYGGAKRTMRWAGRGVQLHNLARPPLWLDQTVAVDAVLGGYVDVLYPDPLDVVKGVVRGAFIPAKGCTFPVSDLSNIEGRVTAWVCGEEWKLQAFRDFDAGIGPDIYVKTFSESFHKLIDEVTKDDRQIGKVQELAGGYQGWIGAWRTFEESFGLDPLPEEEVVEIMGSWRDAHPATRRTWKNLEEAWKAALDNPGCAYTVGKHLTFRYYKKRDLMAVWLPSGRFVPYLHPRATGGSLRFKGENDKGMWTWIDTYGGKLLENIVQAIARDILACAMLDLENMGYNIVLHVHDEALLEVPVQDAEEALDDLNAALVTPREWAPGLPLAAAGAIIPRYRKE